MAGTLTRRLRQALLLAIALMAAAGFAAGCTQVGNVRARLSPSGGTGTSPVSSASIGPTSPSATTTPTVQPSVSATTSAPAPTATASPTGAAPAPAASGSPAPANGSASLLWLWVLIAVIAVGGLIALVSVARHRTGRIRDWRAMAVDTFAQGAALHDAVSAAGRPGQYGSGNSGARWADIQRRADDLTQGLYRLREAAPGEDERARADDVLASLYALRSATQTGSSYGGLNAGNLQVRLRDFDAALQALHEPE